MTKMIKDEKIEMTPEVRAYYKKIALKGGNTTLKKYGKEHFIRIQKLSRDSRAKAREFYDKYAKDVEEGKVKIVKVK